MLLVGVAMLASFSVVNHPHPPVSPDDALYFSVAHSVVEGHGLSMPSREPFVVRPALFPAVLAGAIAVAGDPGALRLLRLVITAAIACTLLTLGRWWYSTIAGLLAVGLVFTNPSYVEFVASVRIDAFAAALALAALAAMYASIRDSSTAWAGGAGVFLGLAVLAKEPSIVIAAVPLVFGLTQVRTAGWRWVRFTAIAWAVAGAICAPWWLYVWAVTGRFYLTSVGGWAAIVLGAVALGGLVAIGLTAVRLGRSDADLARFRLLHWLARGRRAPVAGIAVLAAWQAAAVFVLLQPGAGGPGEGATSAGPSLLLHELRPFFVPVILALLGVAALVVALVRRGGPAVFHAVAVSVYFPLAVAVVWHGWATGGRNLLVPLLLLQVAVGHAFGGLDQLVAAAALSQTARTDERARSRLVAPVVVSTFGFVIALSAVAAVWEKQVEYRSRLVTTTRLAAGWDKPEVREMARWMEGNIPPGTPVMTTWLFGSELSRLTHAAYPMPLAPTREVRLASDGDVFRPVGTLFRFADYRFEPAAERGDWLFIRKHPREDYYVALSAHDLVAELRRTGAQYFVLTGEHHTQSTVSIEPVLNEMPGLVPAHAVGGSRNRLVIYRVDAAAMAVVESPPVSVNGFTFLSLLADVSRTRHVSAPEVVRLLGRDRITIPPLTATDITAAARLQALLEFGNTSLASGR